MTIKIPPMPERDRAYDADGLCLTHEWHELMSPCIHCEREDWTDLQAYARSCARLAQEQADRADAAEARLAAVPALPPEDAPSGWAAWLEDQAAMCDPYIQGPKMRRLAAWLAALAAWEGEK